MRTPIVRPPSGGVPLFMIPLSVSVLRNLGWDLILVFFHVRAPASHGTLFFPFLPWFLPSPLLLLLALARP